MARNETKDAISEDLNISKIKKTWKS